MYKCSLPFFIFLLACFHANAQDSLRYHNTTNNGISSANVPLLTVNAEDIKRFPAGNFLDAVEGLFPWVFGAGHQPGEFLYVLNGRLMPDVNSISLNDIAEISFTRNNLYGGLVPLSKAGTFFISTRPAAEKSTVRFSSQFNLVSNGQHRILPKGSYLSYNSVLLSDEIDNSYGNYNSNHISVSQSGKKYGLYAGAYFNDSKIPGSKQQVAWAASFADSNTRTINSKAGGNRQAYGLFADFNYQFSTKLQAGIMASYSHRNVSPDSSEQQSNQFGSSDNRVTVNAPYYSVSAGAFVKWQPLPQLSTRFSVEYTRSQLESTGIGLLYSNLFSYSSKTDSKKYLLFKNEGILIRNELKYELPLKGRFKAGIDVNVLWYKPTTEMKDNFVRTSGQGIFYEQASWWKVTAKAAVANPAIHFSYNDMIGGYAGMGYFFGEKQFSGLKTSDKINPYAGIDFNLKNIFETSTGIDVLVLSFNYARLAENYSFGPEGYSSWLPITSPAHLGTYNSGYGYRLNKNELLSAKLTAGFLKSRLMFEMEWSKLQYDKAFLYYYEVNPGNSYYYASQGSETSKGFSLWISTTLIDRREVKLFSRLNFFVPVVKSNTASAGSLNYVDETSSKAGIQNKLQYKKYFLQVNALLHLNHRYPSAIATEKITRNDWVLNNLLVGYHVPATTGILKNSVLFVQAANLFVSGALKELYLYDRSVGVGFNLAF